MSVDTISIKEATQKICKALGMVPESIARNKHGKFGGWTLEEFIELILVHETGPKLVEACGVGQQLFNRTVKDILVPTLGKTNGGGLTWKYKLLEVAGLRQCTECEGIYVKSNFNKRGEGLEAICKSCQTVRNAESYRRDSTQQSHRRSYEKNKDAIRARNAQYRADRLLRYPAWADLAKIALIYKNCPRDSQVDHIIPLKGKLVSGLHVETNLQYLPKLDNLSKNNSFDIEKFNNGEAWYATDVQPSEKIRCILSGPRKPRSLARITKVCPVCSSEFLVKESKEHQECCSKSCAGKLFQLGKKTEDKLNTSKEVIEKLIWDKPFSVGCNDVSLSDNGLRKMAIRMGCIMPPDRYHTKSIADKKRIREETFKGASGAAG